MQQPGGNTGGGEGFLCVCVCACVWYDNYEEREIKKGIPKPFLCMRKGGGGGGGGGGERERFKGCNYTESRGKIREKG